MKKIQFKGWTHKNIAHATWTVMNTLNLTTVIQKTRTEALARYEKDVVPVTIEITVHGKQKGRKKP